MGVKGSFAGDGNMIAGNSKFFAVPLTGGGGPVLVQRLDKFGRLGVEVPIVNVSKAPVLDLQFNPFYENVLATAHDDGRLNIVRFHEEGVTENIVDPTATLEGHAKKVTALAFNPVANNILASVSADNSVLLWDAERAAPVQSFEEIHGDIPLSVAWNNNGSLLATAAKDKSFKIFDPRDNKGPVQTAQASKGNKKNSVIFADNVGLYIGVVFNERSMRQLVFWDPKKLDAPLNIQEIDQSAGVFIPYYDPDNSLLYLAGKGDSSIKYYEIQREAPYAFFLTQYSDKESQKGLAWLPKRSVNTKNCEIASALRLMSDCIVPVSFQVPRKSDLFQKDLFPDAYAGVAALSAAEYLEGKNAEPVLTSMRPGADKPAAAHSAPAAHSAHRSAADYEAEIAKLKARIAELEGAAQ